MWTKLAALMFISSAALAVSMWQLSARNSKSENDGSQQPPSIPLAARLSPIEFPTISAKGALVEPTEGFRERITKKTFGLFITPETSPVQPDKFTGYHNGVDVEFSDRSDEVPVRAVADGTIVFREWVRGYGGVIVVRHTINGTIYLALYGHLDPSQFPPQDVTRVKAGDVIGFLGDAFSQETDGARKHLHFSIHPGETPDMRGYVTDETELSGWFDPLRFYEQ